MQLEIMYAHCNNKEIHNIIYISMYDDFVKKALTKAILKVEKVMIVYCVFFYCILLGIKTQHRHF